MTQTTSLQPRLTVVGAGIGDPELLTIKTVKALQQADVVLYDALIKEALFEDMRPKAVRVYVGKRRHHKTFSQDAINQLVVGYARDDGHVVRLKGGDTVNVFTEENEYFKLPADDSAVIIMVGTDTGVAPFRAFVEERTERGASGRNWFFSEIHILKPTFCTRRNGSITSNAAHSIGLMWLFPATSRIKFMCSTD